MEWLYVIFLRSATIRRWIVCIVWHIGTLAQMEKRKHGMYSENKLNFSPTQPNQFQCNEWLHFHFDDVYLLIYIDDDDFDWKFRSFRIAVPLVPDIICIKCINSNNSEYIYAYIYISAFLSRFTVSRHTHTSTHRVLQSWWYNKWIHFWICHEHAPANYWI